MPPIPLPRFPERWPASRFRRRSLNAGNIAADCVHIDGEITALDENGRSSFQLLQGYGKAKHRPLVYYAFDLLSLDSADLLFRSLTQRRKLLAKLFKNPPENIKFSEELTGTKEELLRVAKHFELEGLIAKRPDSLYEPGRRSGAWVKIELTQQREFVIGGYAPPEGSRKYFGALVVGYYGPEVLLFTGRVGTGFSQKGCTMASRKSGVLCALSSTCLRELEAGGDRGFSLFGFVVLVLV
jgi:bifunctional non-homologous end joining protein LigD